MAADTIAVAPVSGKAVMTTALIQVMVRDTPFMKCFETVGELTGESDKVRRAIGVAEFYMTSPSSYLLDEAAVTAQHYDNCTPRSRRYQKLEMLRCILDDLEDGKTVEEIAGYYDLCPDEMRRYLEVRRLIETIAS